jgi:membrane-associated phospholipid phosphatase
MAALARTGSGIAGAAREPRAPRRLGAAVPGARDHVGRAAAAFAALALATASDAGERLARADRAAMAVLPAWRSPRGIVAARVVSRMAEPASADSLLAAVALIAARRRDWRAVGLTAVAVPGGVAARWLLSEAIARPRPPSVTWLDKPTGYSLPSRHTTIAAQTAGALVMAAGTRGLPRRAIPFLAAAAVGTSRVYLGVHWPSDVLAGWLFAEIWLGLAERAVPGPAPARPCQSEGRQSPREAAGMTQQYLVGELSVRPPGGHIGEPR